mmetsp:Transcript_31863/g.74490  ORF Transcript_31863/g.74490 Transcript_31863/m.74490 type:complete len:119 (+) Transcript_31863:149-505(+)
MGSSNGHEAEEGPMKPRISKSRNCCVCCTGGRCMSDSGLANFWSRCTGSRKPHCGKPSEGYDADAEEEDATDSELMPPRRMSVSDQLEILRRSSNAASRGGATATSSPLGGSSSLGHY